MRYGICTKDPAVIADAREAGFDYVEASVPDFVRPNDPESAFEDAVASFRATGMPVESVNLFLMGDLHCTGPDANHDRIVEYADLVLRRLGKAGVSVVVFGSGWARKIPDGWPREKAEDQFIELLARLGPIAEPTGVKIAVEPLARVECNFINTVDEGARLARASGSSAIGVLADSFHWGRNGESADTIAAARGGLLHAHVATMPSRLSPGMEEYDFLPFFGALAAIGYDGRVSIEGRVPPPESRLADLRRALGVLRDARAATAPEA